MTIDYLRLAKHICKVTDFQLNPLDLQKIIYLANMLWIGKTGKPLVTGQFVAEKYGPQHTDLYNNLKPWGPFPIQDFHFDGFINLVRTRDLSQQEHKKEIEFIRNCLECWLNLPKTELMNMVQSKHGAWSKKYVKYAPVVSITDLDMVEEYSQWLKTKDLLSHKKDFNGENHSNDLAKYSIKTQEDLAQYKWEWDGKQIKILGPAERSPAYYRGERKNELI